MQQKRVNAGGLGVFPAACLAHLLMAARVWSGSARMCYSLSICPQVITWKSTEGKKLRRNLAPALSSFMVLVATWAWDTTRVMRQLDTTACWCSRMALITRYHLQCWSPQDLTHSCLAVCNLPTVPVLRTSFDLALVQCSDVTAGLTSSFVGLLAILLCLLIKLNSENNTQCIISIIFGKVYLQGLPQHWKNDNFPSISLVTRLHLSLTVIKVNKVKKCN